MSISPAGNSATAISLAYISSPDDALDLSNATQSELTDKLRESISAQVTVAGSLINKLERLNQIANRLTTYGTGAFKPVTVDSLSATPKTSAALKSLFDNDGPSLGSDIEDANATISDLNSLGVTINALKLTPQLIEIKDKNKAVVQTYYAWVTDQQIAGINSTPVKSTTYPGANERSVVVNKDFTLVYSSFDQYAKLTPSQTDVNTAIAKMAELVKSLGTEFSSILDKAREDSNKLQILINNNEDTKKNQSQQIIALAAQQKEQVTAILNKLRILKIEREASLQKQDNKIGPEISAIAKNASNRVENVSSVDADISSRSSSVADANDANRRLQQSLSGLAAGPNTNTPDNRIPV